MGLSAKHPTYSEFLEDWETCRDCYRGERVIKEKGFRYLPATSGMLADGALNPNTDGWKAYQAYKTRAVFHELFADAVEFMIGVMWSKPPTIELPAKMEPMREKATAAGESLEQFLRRINEQQLVTGRLGILGDLPEKPDPENPLPYLALYRAEHVINWDDGRIGENAEDSLNLVVLDETEWVRGSDFSWKQVEKYRALVLGSIADNEGNDTGVSYKVGVFEGASYSEDDMIEPVMFGKSLERIPFVFVNSKDLTTSPDDPPLLGLARLCLAIYRGEADYRQALFMQAQDTLVVVNGSEESYRIGAGAVIKVKEGGDAKFIGCNSQGLSEMRQSLENDKAQATSDAGSLTDTRSRQKESGEALNIRVAAQTATLNQIAITGAEALERELRILAEWMGANPDEVKVEPNLDFSEGQLTGKDLIDFMTAKTMGAPLSLESIHGLMSDKGLTDKTLEEELDLIAEEEPTVPGGPGTITNPDDPNYDPNMDPSYDPSSDPNSSKYKDPDVDHEREKDLIAAKGKASKPKGK